MNKKRILFLSHVAPVIHGQALMASQLAGIMESWHDIDIKVINTSYADDRADLGGFSFGKLIRWLNYLARMFGTLCVGRVDTVLMTHSFFPGPFLKDSAFVWLARIFGKKLIVWVHMDPARFPWRNGSRLLTAYARRVVRLPHRWVACTSALIRQWPEEFPREKITAVSNGIPDPAIPFSHRSEEKLKVIFLSSMTEEKGWQELFAAAEILCQESNNLIFDFYGDAGAGESTEHLRDVFANSAFPDRIRWHGGIWGEKKFQVLLDADLFCLPSWTEAFPIAVIEAMACGLPVIATRVGGIPDAIQHEENGWLYSPRNAEELLDVMRNAIAHRDRFAMIGDQNRKRFMNEFSLLAFEKKWHELLQSI